MSIDISDVRPPITGSMLLKALNRTLERRAALAEGFIYEHTITMIAADPGLGKSTISTQLAVELSSGLPVFGLFHVAKPVKVLYIQAERSCIEVLERLDIINKVIPIIHDNLYLTDEYQRFNLLNYDHVDYFIRCVRRDCPDVGLIIVDPIYATVSGGLSNDLPASAFTKAMSRLQVETGAALLYNHHTVKPQHSRDGAIIEKEDPFYGSQWLKAHVTGSYYMKGHENGVKLLCKKDNYNLLTKSIHLEYNPETELSSIPVKEIATLERLKVYLRKQEIDKKTFTFEDMKTHLGCAVRNLRAQLKHPEIMSRLVVVSSIRNKNLYKSVSAQKNID